MCHSKTNSSFMALNFHTHKIDKKRKKIRKPILPAYVMCDEMATLSYFRKKGVGNDTPVIRNHYHEIQEENLHFK